MKRGGLIYALAQLSERERALVLILTVIVLPLAVVFLAVMPLMEARDRAANAAQEARATLNWVSDQVRSLPVDASATGTVASGPDPIGISGIEESLVSFALRDFAKQLANRADGGVDLALEEAPFEALSGWMQSALPELGYDLRAFRIDAASPGKVNAQFELGVAP